MALSECSQLIGSIELQTDSEHQRLKFSWRTIIHPYDRISKSALQADFTANSYCLNVAPLLENNHYIHELYLRHDLHFWESSPFQAVLGFWRHSCIRLLETRTLLIDILLEHCSRRWELRSNYRDNPVSSNKSACTWSNAYREKCELDPFCQRHTLARNPKFIVNVHRQHLRHLTSVPRCCNIINYDGRYELHGDETSSRTAVYSVYLFDLDSN